MRNKPYQGMSATILLEKLVSDCFTAGQIAESRSMTDEEYPQVSDRIFRRIQKLESEILRRLGITPTHNPSLRRRKK